jgi:hypothetical protein
MATTAVTLDPPAPVIIVRFSTTIYRGKTIEARETTLGL